MAIRRCPYCKAIIDESQKYCDNCGTQLLFPDDDLDEEPIKGEKIVDDDFPDDSAEDDIRLEVDDIEDDDDEDIEAPETEEREEIDLAEVIEEGTPLPGDELPEPAESEIMDIVEDEKEAGKTEETGDDEEIAVIREEDGGDEREALLKPAEDEAPEGDEPEPTGREEDEFPEGDKNGEEEEDEERKDLPAESVDDGKAAVPETSTIPDTASLPAFSSKEEISRLIDEFERDRRRITDTGPGKSFEQAGEGDAAADERKDDIPWSEEAVDEPGASGVGEEAAADAVMDGDDEDTGEAPGPSRLSGDTVDFEGEVQRAAEFSTASSATIGIPESPATGKDALPFPSGTTDEDEDDGGVFKGLFKKRRRRDAGEPKRPGVEDAADEAPPAESGKHSAAPPATSGHRLGLIGRIKAFLFDLAVVAVFWIAAVGLAARFMSVPVLDLVAAAAVPLALLFAALLMTYLFLFFFFLGETPGGRLAAPKS